MTEIKLQNKELTLAIRNYSMKYFKDKVGSHSNRNYKEERPPFPLLDIYYDLVCELQYSLETKIHRLCFEIVSDLGDIVKSGHVENLKQLEEILKRYFIDDSFVHILKDKKFINYSIQLKVILKQVIDNSYTIMALLYLTNSYIIKLFESDLCGIIPSVLSNSKQG